MPEALAGAVARPLRVLVVDSSERAGDAWLEQLNRTGFDVRAAHADSMESLRDALDTFAPEVVLGAVPMARSAIPVVTEVRPACPFILVAPHVDGATAVAALRLGAEDIVDHGELGRLGAAVEAAIAVRKRLTSLSPRQLQVLTLVAEGNTSPEIAARLNISVKTVETHRGELMKRLGTRDVVGLVRYAIRVALVAAL